MFYTLESEYIVVLDPEDELVVKFIDMTSSVFRCLSRQQQHKKRFSLIVIYNSSRVETNAERDIAISRDLLCVWDMIVFGR